MHLLTVLPVACSDPILSLIPGVSMCGKISVKQNLIQVSFLGVCFWGGGRRLFNLAQSYSPLCMYLVV